MSARELKYAPSDGPTGGIAEMSLRGKRVCVFGLQGSGKSYWSKYVALHYNSLIFDIHGEYRQDLYSVWRPRAKQHGPELMAEFDAAMQKFVFSKDYSWDMLVIDEANQYFPNRKPLPPAMARLNDFNRHMNLGFMCVARRPSQLHTDLTELAHYNIFFKLEGVNDMQRLRDIYPGLDSLVFSLGPHEFAVHEPGKGIYRCAPLSI